MCPEPAKTTEASQKTNPPTKSTTVNGTPLTTMLMPTGTIQWAIQLAEEVWPTGCAPPVTHTQAAETHSQAITQLEDKDN
jgi:hypothetical protein